MAILTDVEAKSLRGRMIQLSIILGLTIGGITILYPFLIMVSGSVRSEMDEADLSLVPQFVYDPQILSQKFFETKYDQDILALNQAHLEQNFSFRLSHVPSDINDAAISDFKAFFDETDFPRHWQNLGGVEGVKTVPEALRELRDRLHVKFDGDLNALSRNTGSPTHSWGAVVVLAPDWLSQRVSFERNAIYESYFEMLEESSLPQRRIMSVTGYFLETMIFPSYGQGGELGEDGRPKPVAYNQAHAKPISTYHEFRLPQHVPGEDQPRLRKEWLEFVEMELNPSFVVIEGLPVSMYQQYLKDKYDNIESLNGVWSTQYTSFQDVALPAGQWLSGSEREDYLGFIQSDAVKPENLKLVGPEFAWQQWLEDKYKTVEALNQAYGTDYGSFAAAWMPLADIEKAYVLENANSLRWTYASRNFINVFNELFVQGRAFLNTVIFCVLSILAAILINPLAAYAMSRFKLPGTYKILLLLMATISFPPMVTMIPQFILLRQLDLLNTFTALLLPGLANGYLIFLLKGFFDSLPQELYEAARIDGASEVRMFFQITLSLSKPILAVVGLTAFNNAYMMFLYALIVAPDESMWLLSVWLYQYQQEASSSGIFASVLIASVPTLVVFIFAQRTIMRGIVVPTEK